MRRLTASAEARTIRVGASSTISCSAVNWAAPAITTIEKAMVSATLRPASVARTPKSTANGPTTSINGALSVHPRQNAGRAMSVFGVVVGIGCFYTDTVDRYISVGEDAIGQTRGHR